VLELWDTLLEPLTAVVAPSLVGLAGEAAELATKLNDQRLRTITIDPSEPGGLSELPDLAFVDVAPGATVLEVARSLRRLARESDSPLPVIVIANREEPEGNAPYGLLAALETLQEDDSQLQVTLIPGLGDLAVVSDSVRLSQNDRLARLIGSLAPGSPLQAHIVAIEAGRRRALERADRAERALADAEAELKGTADAAAERDRLRASLSVLADARAEMIEHTGRMVDWGSPLVDREREAETHVRQRLAELGAGAVELAAPLPADHRDLLSRADASAPRIILRASDDAEALRACIWSLLDRSEDPIQLAIAVPDDIAVAARVAAEAVVARIPRIEIVRIASGAPTADAAEERVGWTAVFERPAVVPHGWMTRVAEHLDASSAVAIPGTGAHAFAEFGVDAAALALGKSRVSDRDPAGTVARAAASLGGTAQRALGALMVDDARRLGEQPDRQQLESLLRDRLEYEQINIAYVLPGVPEGGSGGAISVLQEAAELGRLGVEVCVVMEAEGVRRAHDLIPAASPWLREVEPGQPLADALSSADVVVATEAQTVASVAEAAPPKALRAYYAQDYEALFGRPGTARADGALLSYRRASWGGVYAKTHWLANLISSAHQIPVGKIDPSLDRELFHAIGREDHSALRVVAMVRPRTPRRRPAMTLTLLARLATELADKVECFSFGCHPQELKELIGDRVPSGVTHLGVLGRPDVAEVMRRCDVFVDMSIYQAFGRTGLEAMACGAVPILPRLGGVSEYARDRHDALLLESSQEAFEAIAKLVEDRETLHALRREGIRSAGRFSTLRSAMSQYGLLSASLRAARVGR
jgi:glycosyltransferase involved in cell wall biosynthesis